MKNTFGAVTAEGEQEIMKITEGERMDVETRFVRPSTGYAMAPHDN